MPNGDVPRLNEEARQRLVQVGEEILATLLAISEAATANLTDRPPSPDVLVNPAPKAHERLLAISAELRQMLHKLRCEPAISRVVVEWQETELTNEIVYICRGSAAGLGSVSKIARLASYRSPLGRLAELLPGDHELISLPRSTEREGRIIECSKFEPVFDGAGWDAVECSFSFLTWQRILQSIKKFIHELGGPVVREDQSLLDQVLAEAAAAEIFLQTVRRHTIDRIALRDQAVLDAEQGSIFRLPLNYRIVLLGPPGTGKTTTLIKRIAQKRTVQELGEDERQLVMNSGVDVGDWIMYTPTDLLKLYLRDAFNKEDVPADSRNLKTWESERLQMARDTFGILRGASGGRYILTDDVHILRDGSSPALSQLHDEFADYVYEYIASRCTNAVAQIEGFEGSEAEDVRRQITNAFRKTGINLNAIYALANNHELSEEVHRLGQRTSDIIRSQTSAILNREVFDNLLIALRVSGQSTSESNDDDVEIDDEDAEAGLINQVASEQDQRKRAVYALQRTIRYLAQNAVHRRAIDPDGETALVIRVLENRVPLGSAKIELGRLLLLRNALRRLSRAARDMLFKAPTVYARFRRDAIRDRRQWYIDGIDQQLRSNRLSSMEIDVLLFYMLRTARELSIHIRDTPWLDRVRDRYATQVYIDEATDFSSVQLGCMLEQAHPKFRSWFACGDFRQRITASGITGPEELMWIRERTGSDQLVQREVKKFYRQSPGLVRLATALSQLLGFEESAPVVGNSAEPEIRPLIKEGISGDRLGRWISERILEIERAVGYLPSIGVLVDGEEQIDSLVANAASYLNERSIRIVGCHNGRVIGESQEVRVFDLKHIKGLEFEAVFFVGLDKLAERLPTLFDRYLYVAITRAATYLAVTSEGELPARLRELKAHFATGTWEGYRRAIIDLGSDTPRLMNSMERVPIKAQLGGVLRNRIKANRAPCEHSAQSPDLRENN